jgi:uncharacterized membrane protein YraQ (UPF0718 family)
MSQPIQSKTPTLLRRVALLLVVAIVGFAYVKWVPYYAKAFVAQSQHSIGASILVDAQGEVPAASWRAAVDYAVAYGASIWKAMVLGLVLGSGLTTVLPARWMARALGRLGARSTFLGAVLALPCMMCTCCAAPVAAGMKQRQASVGSVVAWWLANPLLNPATLVFMGFVLGWNWVALRLVFGIAMVLGIAWLAERVAGAGERSAVADLPVMGLEETEPTDGLVVRWAREFLRLALRLVPEYLVLVLLLGAARVWMFPAHGLGDGPGWIIAMALAGTLFVIPTAGEVPIVQTLLALGGGSGPAAALLLTLPAVSLPSLAMLGTALDRRTRGVIAIAVVAFGIAAGLLWAQLF